MDKVVLIEVCFLITIITIIKISELTALIYINDECKKNLLFEKFENPLQLLLLL
jgi:hypothetical protein